MGRETKIQWCDSTVNLLVGCYGCELYPGHCYASQLVRRYAGRPGWPRKFTEPQLYVDRINKALAWSDLTGTDRPEKPWLNGMPRMIFVNDLGDAWSPAAEKFLDLFHPLIWRMVGSAHIWIFLTKWPDRLATYVNDWQKQYLSTWPENVWLGISATTQRTFDTRAHSLIHGLRLHSPRTILLASLEPMLKPIKVHHEYDGEKTRNWLGAGGLDWVIVGGESGRNARPCDVRGIEEVLRECAVARTPAFVKQLGAQPFMPGSGGERFDWPCGYTVKGGATWLNLSDPKGGNEEEWPWYLQVRQVPHYGKGE